MSSYILSYRHIFIYIVITLPIGTSSNLNLNDGKLIKNLENIINFTFQDQNCIHYIVNDHDLITLANYELITLINLMKLPVVLMKYEKSNACIPTGYIVESIKSMKINEFLPHKRLLIFASKLDTSLIYLTERKGVDVCVVEMNENGEKINFTHLRSNETISLYNSDARFSEEFVQEQFNKLNNSIFGQEWIPNFGTETFKISVVDYEPFLYYDPLRKRYNGLEFYIIKNTAKGWPIEFISYINDDDAINEVVIGKTDVMAGLQWDVKGVELNMEMSFPYGVSCVTYIIPKAQPLAKSAFVFRPFDTNLWILIFIFDLVIVLMLYLVYKKFYDQKVTFIDLVIVMIRITAMNSLPKLPKQKFVKQIYLSTLVTTMLLSIGYSVGLANILELPRYTKPILTYKDLIESGIKCYYQNSYTLSIMKASNNPYVRQLIEESILIENYTNASDTCHAADSLTGYVISHNPTYNYANTNMKLLPECYGIYTIRLLFTQNSPFTKLFTEKIIRFVEHGFIGLWVNYVKLENLPKVKFMDNFYDEHSFAINDEEIPIIIKEMQGAFYLLIVGLTTSLIVFICEKFNRKLAAKPCNFDGVGELYAGQKASVPGKCMEVTCQSNGNVGALTCPLGRPAPGCSFTDVNYSKDYPDCCPKHVCQ